VGSLHMSLGAEITDVAGNALAPTGATWNLAPWVRTDLAGTTPSLAVDSAQIVVARSVDGPSGRRVLVSRWDGRSGSDLTGPLGSRDAALPSIVLDRDSNPTVVWTEFPPAVDAVAPATIEAVRWIGGAWKPLASPGEGSFAVVAQPLSGDPIIAYTAPSRLTNGTVVRVRVLAGTTWQPI